MSSNMGQKSSRILESCSIHVAEFSTIGRRKSNEDETVLKLSAPPKKEKLKGEAPCLFGVFDGHSGGRASQFAASKLPKAILSHPEYPENMQKVFDDAYRQVDKEFLASAQKKGFEDGSTGLVSVIHNKKIYVANAGDCRAVLSEKGEAKGITLDHKPNTPIEQERIERFGGTVANGRISGNLLSVSRGFGDLKYKNNETLEERLVSVVPDVFVHDLTEDTEFLLLACDGIWDVLTTEDVVTFVRGRLANVRSAMQFTEDISRDLFMICLALTSLADQRGSNDNMTVVLVVFDHNKGS